MALTGVGEFCARELGVAHNAPTAYGDLKEHREVTPELHRRRGAPISAQQDDEDPELRGLMRMKERGPSPPTPPSGPRKAPSSDSAPLRPEPPPLSSPRGAVLKTTKSRRPSSGPRKTHGQIFSTGGASSLPLADPPLSSERHSRFHTYPPQGNRRNSLSDFTAPFLLFRSISLVLFPGGRGQENKSRSAGVFLYHRTGPQHSKISRGPVACVFLMEISM